jgi:transforming growth factor-beta-induced protein
LLANTTQLTDVLLYHALAGSFSSRQVASLKTAPTVEGSNVQITVAGGSRSPQIFVNQAKVIQANIQATNGYIHVLDGVLVGRTSIVSQAAGNAQLTTLVTALQASGLLNALAAMPSVTVFAPTNTAFNNLPSGVLQGLLNNVTALQQVLLYHVLPTAQFANQLVAKQFSKTLQFDVVFVDSDATGNFYVNGGAIAVPDVFASTGVIQVIDNVLIPY